MRRDDVKSTRQNIILQIIAEQEMPKDATKITIKDVSVITGMEWVRYRINAEKGSKIRIRSIETIAQ